MAVLSVPTMDEQPWPTLGPQVCQLIEERAVYGPGDLRGMPAVLDEETRALIYRSYEVFPQGHERAGKRRFKRVAWELRKGSAKTEKGAWVGFAELHPEGPVRCDGWDANGNPVGAPVRDPYIPMVGYTEEQTEELAFGVLYVVCTEGPDADLFDAKQGRVDRATGDGKVVALATSPGGRDGARTTFQLFDETHRLTLPRLIDAHQTMLQNIPKRPKADPWSMEITTAGVPGERSVAEVTRDYGEMVAKGELKNPQLFYFRRYASEKHDLDTDDGLRAAIVEASGPAIAKWADIDSIANMYHDPDTDKSYFERVWLNRWVASNRQAFDPVQWRSLAEAGAELKPDEPITLGFDGSKWHDATALVATGIHSGLQVLLGLWESDGTDEWEVDTGLVSAVVKDAFERYNVTRLYGDPAAGWDVEMARWSEKFGEKKVAAFYTDSRSTRKIATATTAYGSAIRGGDIRHNGDPRFSAHIANARRRDTNLVDDIGQPLFIIEKERRDSVFKIDAAMAGTLSWQARLDALAAGEAESSELIYYTY